MEESSFLMSVNRIVRRIQVQNDLKRRSVVRIQEMIVCFRQACVTDAPAN
jgi:hypothetical protein